MGTANGIESIAKARSVSKGWSKVGFKLAVQDLFEDPEELRDMISFIPDLYKVDSWNKEIQILEIEDTNSLSKERLFIYVDFWNYCAGEEITMRLFVTDRYGLEIKELPMEDFETAMIQDTVSKQKLKGE